MENLRLGVSAVRHDMKREETVEEAEKNTELGRQTPKRKVGSSNLPGGAKKKRQLLLQLPFFVGTKTEETICSDKWKSRKAEEERRITWETNSCGIVLVALYRQN